MKPMISDMGPDEQSRAVSLWWASGPRRSLSQRVACTVCALGVRPSCIGVICLAATWAWTASAVAIDTHWQADPESRANWFDALNWTNGVPVRGTDATIDNDGTATMAGGVGRARHLWVGFDDAGVIELSAGALGLSGGFGLGFGPNSHGEFFLSGGKANLVSIGVGEGGSGLLDMSGGTINLETSLTVGVRTGGSGQVIQSAGTVKAKDGFTPRVRVGGRHDAYGRYDLIGGLIDVDRLEVGGFGGEFIHIGGVINVADDVTVGGGGPGAWGHYWFGGLGQLNARSLIVSADDSGPNDFTQDAGSIDVSFVRLGTDRNSEGTYRLNHGSLQTGQITIGTNGLGRFVQARGHVVAERVEMRSQLSTSSGNGESIYQLAGGTLRTEALHLGAEGPSTFEQTGGRVRADGLRLEGDPAFTKYQLFGGALKVVKTMRVQGENDFGDQAVALTVAPNAFVDLSEASVSRAGSAAFELGQGSLLVVAPGTDLPSMFGTFVGANYPTYELGAPLHVRANEVVALGHAVDIDDHLVLRGMAYEVLPLGVNLNGGMTIDGGLLDIGTHGVVSIRDRVSRITSGSATMARLRVVKGGTEPIFTQSGGSMTVTERLEIGTGSAMGRYHMNGGRLAAREILIGRSSAAAPVLRQTDGTVDVGVLDLDFGGNGQYVLLGGLLRSGLTLNPSLDGFIHSGGIHEVDMLVVAGRYEYTGGELVINGGLELIEISPFGDLFAILDFGSAATQIVADGVLLNLLGSVSRAQNATVDMDRHSLVIHEPGFNPAGTFKTYRNRGITHVKGNTLTIGIFKEIHGTGRIINDPVVVKGKLIAKGFLDINGGITVTPGAVADLGLGTLRVNDDTTRIAGGRLSAFFLFESEPVSLVTQTDGVVSLEHVRIDSGARYLFTGGTLNVGGTLRLDFVSTSGVFDFGEGDGVLRLRRGGYIDFSRGSVLRAQNASIDAAPNTLISFPDWFDPAIFVGSLTSRGIVHRAGQPITITEGTAI